MAMLPKNRNTSPTLANGRSTCSNSKKLIKAQGKTYLMLKVCERFPQIGTITDYMALPPGERALYDWYTLEAIRAEAGAPVLRIEMPKGGRRR